MQRVLLGLNSLDPVLVRKEHSPLGKIPEAALITDSKPFPLGPYLFALKGSGCSASFQPLFLLRLSASRQCFQLFSDLSKGVPRPLRASISVFLPSTFFLLPILSD